MMTIHGLSRPLKACFTSPFPKDHRAVSVARALRIALLASVLGGIATSALGADDSVWINKGIRDALAKGKREYILPVGKFNLSSSIVIPDGTRNFTLRGSGKNLTTFRGNNGIGYAIFAGIQTIMWNNYGVSNLPTVLIDNVVEGGTTLKLASLGTVQEGDYLALWDEGYVKHYLNGDAQRNHSEIVRVVSVNAANKTVTLDAPVGRDYTLVPKVSFINDKIVANITIKDMGFDGTVAGTDGRNNGILSLGVSDGINLSNLDVSKFSTRALTMNWARNVSVKGVTIADGANAGNPGSAYGVTICRSRNVTVNNCYSTETRHSYLVTNGSTDITFDNCIADGYNGNFDTHGFDERRISYIRCTATGTLNLGNDAYLGGGKDYLIKDSSFLYSVLLYSNVTKVRALNSKFWGIGIYSRWNTKGWPTGGMSDDVVFTNCNFEFNKSMLSENGEFGNITFDRCKFVANKDSYAQIFQSTWSAGNFTLTNCDLVSFATSAQYPPTRADIASANYSLTMTGCKVYSAANSWTAVWLTRGFKGRATLNGNILYTNNAAAPFCWNDSTSTIISTNNKTYPLAWGALMLPPVLKP